MPDNLLLEIYNKPIIRNHRSDSIFKEFVETLVNFYKFRLHNEEISLRRGMAWELLFLLYYNKYRHDESVEELAYKTAAKIYRLYKRNKIKNDIHDYFNGITGVVSVFEHITKYQLLETDVDQVFQKVDFGVHNHLLYKKEAYLGLSHGLAAKGLFMLARIRKTTSFTSEQELRPIEALIRFVDKVETAFEAGETKYPENSFIDDLSICMILLAKILVKDIYPEITERLLDRLIGFMEKTLSNELKNTRLNDENKINVLYSYWKVNNIFPEKAVLLNPFGELYLLLPPILNSQNTAFLFDTLRLIQQLNELQWAIKDEKIKNYNRNLLHQIIEKYSKDTGDNTGGLSGGAGVGLLILSFMSKDCLSWDEIIGLS